MTGIRVDGLDVCSVDISGILGATSGKVRFNWTPRHGDGDWEKWWDGDYYVTVFQIRKDGSNIISLQSTSNTALSFACECGGVLDATGYDGAGLMAGTTYLVEVEYNSTDCTLKIDGVLKATSSPAGGIDFGANIPDTVYLGQAPVGNRQGDAVFSAP